MTSLLTRTISLSRRPFRPIPSYCLRNPVNPTNCCKKLSSDSAAYAGDGKTVVKVLNSDDTRINLVNSYSAHGFRLSNNLFINGSIIVFPTNVFAWAVGRGKDINLDSLLVFDLIVPKVKILIIGFGEHGEPYDASIAMKLKKKGISCEMLPTPNAVTTYNYLVHDSVHVAGAFVPVIKEVFPTEQDAQAEFNWEKAHEERPEVPEETERDRELIDYQHKRRLITDAKDSKDKSKFDD